MPEYALDHARILFLVPLLFVASIPTYFLNFKFFNHSSCIVEVASKRAFINLVLD